MVKPWTFLGDMGAAVHDHALKKMAIVLSGKSAATALAFNSMRNLGSSYVSEPGTEMLMVRV